MWLNLHSILLIAAFVCFLVDACWRGEKPPVLKLTPLGLAFLTLALLLPGK